MQIEIPLIGLGTYELLDQECTETVESAFDLGYRHFDTAHYYNNHKAIGKVLHKHSREEFFLTSKYTPEQIDDHHIETSVRKSCEKALHELQTDYLDLYLLHWPKRDRPYIEMVAAMQPLLDTGLIRAFGVCNCTIHHLQDLHAAFVYPQVNQVEFHLHLYQKDLLDFCQKHHITLEAYRSLGKGALLQEPHCAKIAAAHNKSVPQVLLRWAVQKGIPVIPKSHSPKHLKENLDIFDFTLTSDEMKSLDTLPNSQRYCESDVFEFNY